MPVPHSSADEAVRRLGGLEKERKRAERLWELLDDIDTADDAAGSDRNFRAVVRKIIKKRYDVFVPDHGLPGSPEVLVPTDELEEQGRLR